MHREPKLFINSVKQQYPEYFTDKNVLEVGSLDINGSVRPFFTDCVYTGIDLGEGKGVDAVMHVTELSSHHGSFDVVISTETLEHDARWSESLKAMFDLLEPDGLLLITCAAPNRPEHGTARTGSAEASPFTSSYYRNISVEDFASVLPANLFEKSYLGYRGDMDDLYFAGIKKAKPNGVSYSDWWAEVMPRIDVDKQIHREDGRLSVTAEISTKDRYHILPMCIAAILNQTRKPDRLVIYDDGEQKDLRELSPFDGLLRWADDLGISWEFFSTPREGQVTNHQHALDNCQTELIWRVDDDEVPESNCLENLLAEMKDGVGAVAGLVHHPGGVSPLPSQVDGSLNDVSLGLNLQWFDLNGSGPQEVEHLYSTFLFRVQAGREAGGYPKGLSCAGHREETIFTHSIKRAGYSLVVTPYAKTIHLRSSTGGIRSYSDSSLWAHDEEVFQQYLKTWGVIQPDTKLVILDCGLGDTLLFKGLLPELRRKHPNRKWTLAVCYPTVFENEPDITVISIADAKLIIGAEYDQHSLYAFCWRENKTQPLVDSMREFWG